jgi:hypothetical protein
MNDRLHQAVQGVSARQRAIFNLFDRIENFFRRLEAYIEVRPTAGMTDVIVNVLVEILLIVALVIKEIEQGKLSELIVDNGMRFSTYFLFREIF